MKYLYPILCVFLITASSAYATSQYLNGNPTANIFIDDVTGLIGQGSSTPWANFSVSSANASVVVPLFVVASSSVAVSTTTLFMVRGDGNVGVGTTTPYAKLSVAGPNAANTLFAVSSTTSQGLPNFSIDSVGHEVVSGPPPTFAASACGTSPAVTGNDTAGKITTGTALPKSCTITFANTFTTAPSCIISGAPVTKTNDFLALMSSTTATTMSFMASSTALTGSGMTSWVVSYQCIKTI